MWIALVDASYLEDEKTKGQLIWTKEKQQALSFAYYYHEN